jgi:CRP-like cAMP-binding protein
MGKEPGMPARSQPSAPADPTNQLLDLLPNGERARLLSDMDRIPLEPHDVFLRPGEPLRNVYFPLRGVISLMTPLEDGSAVETATVGREGMLGLHTIFGGGALGNAQAIGQVPGETLRMNVDHFRAETDGDGKFREVLFAYAQALLAQISQGVACNGVHAIQQRCARWLLESHDRAGSDEFRLTQEFLSEMLGVRRASVTVAARTLQVAGLIEYGRGRIKVTDRKGLEEASCECYGVIKEEYRRLVTPD